MKRTILAAISFVLMISMCYGVIYLRNENNNLEHLNSNYKRRLGLTTDVLETLMDCNDLGMVRKKCGLVFDYPGLIEKNRELINSK
jgi:hypothetical protein